MVIELWQVENGETLGSASPVPANQRGRLSLCFVVADREAAAQRIVDYGGQRLDDTLIDAGYADIMFCADPDGTRIELVQMTGDWPGYSEPGQ